MAILQLNNSIFKFKKAFISDGIERSDENRNVNIQFD